MSVTTRDIEIWEAIEDFITDNGFPPTVREVCGLVGLNSPGTVHERLTNLEANGYLTRVAGSPRAIRLVNRPILLPSA